MRFSHRRGRETEEGESYYISMTDMMVGVLFIFIIMLSFFALQFRKSTSDLTKAKDAQTQALLTLATNLERQDVSLEIDRKAKVVCIPGAVLVEGQGSGPADRHCFAYSGSPKQAQNEKAVESRSSLMTFVSADLDAQTVKASIDHENGNISFAADQLFLPGSATLSPAGQDIARRVAATLAARLPCYGYGTPASAACPPDAPKASVVNVVGQAGFDAFTDQGRAAAALSLQRSVAFLQALTSAQPILGQLKSGPAAGAEPLLRVAAYSQSEAAPAAPGAQTISIQFQMAN